MMTQYLRNCPKQLLVLAVSFLMYTNAQAQAGALTISQKSGKIFVSDGVSKKLVATVANNSQPLAAAGHVFYINNNFAGNTTTIKAYDVAGNTTADIVNAETLNSGAPTDKKITNMLFDKTGNRLYFSTVSVNAKGFENYITWYLDQSTQQITQFADGKIGSVDNTGAIQVEMHGVDPQGPYTQTHLKAMDGTPGAVGIRKYTSASNASNN